LLSLRSQSREDVQKALLEMYGIGRKVADCVALFSLDKFDVGECISESHTTCETTC